MTKSITIPPEKLHLLINEELFRVGDSTSDATAISKPYDKLLIITEKLADDQKDTLNKIIQAVGLKSEDVNLLYEWPKDFEEYQKAIIFGDHPNEEYRALNYYEVHQVGKQHLLRSKSIRQLDESREEKMKLWTALKGWFKV